MTLSSAPLRDGVFLTTRWNMSRAAWYSRSRYSFDAFFHAACRSCAARSRRDRELRALGASPGVWVRWTRGFGPGRAGHLLGHGRIPLLLAMLVRRRRSRILGGLRLRRRRQDARRRRRLGALRRSALRLAHAAVQQVRGARRGHGAGAERHGSRHFGGLVAHARDKVWAARRLALGSSSSLRLLEASPPLEEATQGPSTLLARPPGGVRRQAAPRGRPVGPRLRVARPRTLGKQPRDSVLLCAAARHGPSRLRGIRLSKP